MTYLFKKVFVGGPLCGTDLEMFTTEVPSTIDVQKNGYVHRYRFRQVSKEPGFQFLHLGKKTWRKDDNKKYDAISDAFLSEVDDKGVATFFMPYPKGDENGDAQEPAED